MAYTAISRLRALIAGAIAVSLMPVAVHAGQINDAAIVAIYNQVNSIDIETALVGQVKGHSSEVRALAEMVSRDHTGVRKAAHELAVKIGVTPSLPAARAAAAKRHYDVIAKLRAKSGAEFDRAYILHEIDFHRSAIEAVKKILLPATSHPELKAHLESVLPHFSHHLDETIRVAKKLGIE